MIKVIITGVVITGVLYFGKIYNPEFYAHPSKFVYALENNDSLFNKTGAEMKDQTY